MSLIRWDPFADMEDIFNRFPVSFGSDKKGFVPATDMYETKDSVVIKTPLAGIKPADVKLSVQKGVLTLQGESKKEHEVDEKDYYRKEIRGGAFYRQLALPCAVKEEGVTAEFSNGMLKITCPKSAPKEVKKIDIKVVEK